MKITKSQLKQIIKEELTDAQRAARHSPMIAALSATDRGTRASRERAAQAATPAVPDADRILQDMKDAYDRLEGDPGQQKLLEDDLLNGLGDLVAAWRQGREGSPQRPGFEEEEEEFEGY